MSSHKTQPTLFFFAAAFQAGLFFWAPIAAESKAPKDTFKKVEKVEYQSQTAGKIELLLGDDGLIWRAASNHLDYYCMSPKWDIVTHNRVQNAGRVVPYGKWSIARNNKDPIDPIAKSVVPAKFKGLPARLISLVVKPTESVQDQGEFFYRSSTKRTNTYSRIELLDWQNDKLCKQQKEFLRWKLDLNLAEGVPLRRTNIYPDGRRENLINATSVSSTTIPLSDWKVPTKFKIVRKQSELTGERLKYEHAAEMFDTLLP